jgi:hypothetical protein
MSPSYKLHQISIIPCIQRFLASTCSLEISSHKSPRFQRFEEARLQSVIPAISLRLHTADMQIKNRK